MTVIIRLQNLQWSANALDVRRFFQGLVIPDGGVHIVGGEKGDAFIAFATDEDARQAMYLDNGRICDAPIKLLLSSKTEMQNVIAVARGAAVPPAASAPAKSSGGHQLAQSTGPGVSERGLSSLPGSRGVGNDRMGNSNMGQGSRDSGSQLFNQRGPESRLENSYGAEGRLGGPGIVGSQRPGPGPSRMPGGNQGIESGAGNRMPSERIGGAFNRPREEPSRMPGAGRGDRGRPGQARMAEPESASSGWRREGPSRMDTEPSPLAPRQEPHRMERYDREDRQRPAEGRPTGRAPPVFHGEDRRGYAPTVGVQDRDRFPSQERRERAPPPSYDDGGYDDYDGQPRDEGRFHDQRPRDNFGGDQPGENFVEERPRESYGYDRQERYSERPSIDKEVDTQRPREYGRRDESEWDRGPTWEAEYDDRSNDFQDNGDHRDTYENRGDDYREGYNNDYPRNEEYDDCDEVAYDTYDQETGYHEEEYAMEGEYPEEEVNKEPYYRDNQFEGSEGIPQRGMRLGRGRFMRGDRGRGRGRGDFRGRGRGRGFGRGGFGDRPTARFDMKRGGRDSGLYVFLSNMPDTVSYKEIRRFFFGCEIPSDGLKLINDKSGQRNGTAYVMFGKPQDCVNALQRDGQMMDNKRVRIDKCHQEDFDRAIDSYRPGSGPYHDSSHPRRFRSRSPIPRGHPDGSNCMKMMNVHYRATRLDVRNFLGNAKIHDKGGPHIQLGTDGRPTGTAYAQMDSTSDFNAALKLNETFLMHRSVTITAVNKKEFDKFTQEDNNEPTGDTRRVEKSDGTREKENSSNQGSQEEKKFFCIKMKGLPFSATATNIRNFFEGLEIANRGLTLITNMQGQAAGPAFVEFVTSMDCKKAVEKNKQYMGKRYIEIAPITKKDMMEDIVMENQKVSSGPQPPTARPPLKAVPEIPGVSRPGCTITMSNLPFKVQLEDIMTFLQFANPIQDSVRLRYSKDGTPTGDAMVAFRSPGDAQRALRECSRKVMMGRQVLLAMAP